MNRRIVAYASLLALALVPALSHAYFVQGAYGITAEASNSEQGNTLGLLTPYPGRDVARVSNREWCERDSESISCNDDSVSRDSE